MPESDPYPHELADVSKAPERRLRTPEVLQSADLLKGAKEVFIAHGDDVYRLRMTRAGKLMLQK
jgi:hemin uptake protein HemP